MGLFRKSKTMSINYNYEIVAVNEDARCMEVFYTASGHQPMHISARLPYEDESVELIIRMYAPISYWLEQIRPVLVPVVGASGAINAADEEQAALEQMKLPQPIVEGAQDL